LAGKEGFCAGQKAFYFAFLHVFVVFRVCKLLPAKIFRAIFTPEKNRA
jgi:hypothetical protein